MDLSVDTYIGVLALYTIHMHDAKLLSSKLHKVFHDISLLLFPCAMDMVYLCYCLCCCAGGASSRGGGRFSIVFCFLFFGFCFFPHPSGGFKSHVLEENLKRRRHKRWTMKILQRQELCDVRVMRCEGSPSFSSIRHVRRGPSD